MPYIIAVLALVIIGSGFALFQKNVPYEVSNEQSSEVIEISQSGSSSPETPTSSDTLELPPVKTEETQTAAPNTPTVPPKNTPSTPSTPATPTPAPADTNRYTNGTYRTQSTYRTPEGTYVMDVTLVIANDSVTSASLSFDADGARSGYSKRFTSGYQNQVIGKNLEGLNLSRVSGASLTTNAYNNALNNIRSQAS
jgi:cytoskeletal protein RodZ